jgi:hypothetical protein
MPDWREEVRDPWALLVAGVAAGSAWAVGIPAVAAAGVGAAVLGIKALSGMLSGKQRPVGGRTLALRGGSTEHRWMQRAERAVSSFERLASSVRSGPIADRATQIGEEARATLATMQRLAGQASAVSVALRHIDGNRLTSDEQRLRDELRATKDPSVRQAREQSLDAVRDQLEVHARLSQASRTLIARLESGAIELEALGARLAEIVALAETATAPTSLNRIEELEHELEGLRGGLVETEDISRRTIGQYLDAS